MCNKLNWQCQISNISTSWLIRFALIYHGINQWISSFVDNENMFKEKFEFSCIAVEFPLIICIILKLNLCALNSIPSWNLSINLDHFHAEISQKICEFEKCKSKCLTERCVVTCRSSCMHITCEKQKRWSIYFTTHALMNYSNPECVRFQLRPLFCSKFYEIKGFDLISIWEHWSLFYGFRLFFPS